MPTILLVDDEPELVAVTKLRLEANGYEVHTASDGAACLEQVRSRPPDVILLDLVMQGMDGSETCARLREMPEGKDIPVILFTASYSRGIEEKVEELGAFDFILKPFDPADLLQKMARAVAKRKL